jgi:hypothetical protein
MAVFELGLADFLNFKRMQKRFPKVFSKAGAHMLNTSAFETRKLAIENIENSMIGRNERFIKSSVRVKKARLGAPLNQIFSQVGSVERERFSGWREQEGGQQTKREHQAHPAARKNNIAKQVVRRARLRAAGRFPKPTDFRGAAGNPVARAARMIHILSRSGFTKPFLIFGLENKKKGRKVPPGLYQFGSGAYPNRRIKLLQRFKRPKPTRKKPWLQPAREEFVRDVNLRTVWGKAVAFELRKMGLHV